MLRQCVYFERKSTRTEKNRICQNVRFRAFTDAKEFFFKVNMLNHFR